MADFATHYWPLILVVAGLLGATAVFGKNVADLILKWRQVREGRKPVETVIQTDASSPIILSAQRNLTPLEIDILKRVSRARGGRTNLAALVDSLNLPTEVVANSLRKLELSGYVSRQSTANGARIVATPMGLKALFEIEH